MVAFSGRRRVYYRRRVACAVYLLPSDPAYGDTSHAGRAGSDYLYRNHGARACIGSEMTGSFHFEPLLAIVYAVFLMLIAAVLEALARHSHRRADQYHTGGFRFHRDRDAWECPVGIALIRAEIDHEQKIVRYRAPAHTCNS